MRVLVVSGSLKSNSLNGTLADWIAAVAEDEGRSIGLETVVVDRLTLADVSAPNYDYDVEVASGLPPGPRRLADALEQADAVIICSPEYNASMPGALKNVIDWVSRLRPQPFAGQRGLLASASPSLIGGNRGLWALRVPLESLGMHVHPTMYSLSKANEQVNDPRFLDSGTGQRLRALVNQFLLEVHQLRNREVAHR
ncbi:NADPH-dependent FMN reductase [Arthrobacter zhaoguopingii]|uniref:NADPH-dependent FMN reductase n=1 Tax=Arthrobacter zhaoguopingii TaxID=2681491 RepID=UPI0013596426|nr:NAD(P)H-dependent oxidoreductase [Arthrobacter zhaoguopingii]